LDSLGLVRFIVEVEVALQERFGKPIPLANDQAMSQRRSPFLTVGTLTEYIKRRLEEEVAS
jgi:acyl carrier protein